MLKKEKNKECVGVGRPRSREQLEKRYVNRVHNSIYSVYVYDYNSSKYGICLKVRILRNDRKSCSSTPSPRISIGNE